MKKKRSNSCKNIKKSVSFFLENIDEGGAERSVIELANYLAKMGYEVDLVVGYGKSRYREEVSRSVNFIEFESRNKLIILIMLARYLFIARPTTIMSALDHANLMLLIGRKLSGYKGRLIISQRAALSASLIGQKWWRRWIMNGLIKIFFPSADAIISNSKYATSELIKLIPKISKKTFTIHNAVDTNQINKLAKIGIERKNDLRKTSASLVIVGSLTKRKNVELCLRAVKIVSFQKKIHLNIIGDGPERKNLEKLAQALGIKNKVYFRGFDTNPFRWLAKASVLISSSDGEGCSNVILQAMATNCPIVATDCPGDSAELLGHGRWGKLVPVADAQKMATAIIETLERRIKKNTKKQIKQFTISNYLQSYIKVLFCKTPKKGSGVLSGFNNYDSG